MSEFMRNSDAFTWEMEHDPGLRSTIVTVMSEHAPIVQSLVPEMVGVVSVEPEPSIGVTTVNSGAAAEAGYDLSQLRDRLTRH